MITNSCKQTEDLGKELAQTLKKGDFIALYGDLGAGKTAFVRGLAAHLGNVRVSSPTFTIVHEYDTTPPLFHFDVYRIPDEQSLYDIGFDDYLARKGIIVMEWSENVPLALPENRINVHFEYIANDCREIIIEDNRA